LAKNLHRFTGRLPCQPDTFNAVSPSPLLCRTNIPTHPSSDDLVDRFSIALGVQRSSTPRTLNSLSAIAGHEGEEEDWEREMRDLNRGDDEVSPVCILIERHHCSPHFPPPQQPPAQYPSPTMLCDRSCFQTLLGSSTRLCSSYSLTVTGPGGPSSESNRATSNAPYVLL
jgi:hypothetical protein